MMPRIDRRVMRATRRDEQSRAVDRMITRNSSLRAYEEQVFARVTEARAGLVANGASATGVLPRSPSSGSRRRPISGGARLPQLGGAARPHRESCQP